MSEQRQFPRFFRWHDQPTGSEGRRPSAQLVADAQRDPRGERYTSQGQHRHALYHRSVIAMPCNAAKLSAAARFASSYSSSNFLKSRLCRSNSSPLLSKISKLKACAATNHSTMLKPTTANTLGKKNCSHKSKRNFGPTPRGKVYPACAKTRTRGKFCSPISSIPNKK